MVAATPTGQDLRTLVPSDTARRWALTTVAPARMDECARAGPDELLIVAGARRGTQPWDPGWERRLPRWVRAAPHGALALYPAEAWPPLGLPIRTLHLAPRDWADAVARAADALGLRQADRQALADPRRAWEIQPGRWLVHLRQPDRRVPQALVASLHPAVAPPHGTTPAAWLAVLLSPADSPRAHLEALAALARLLAAEDPAVAPGLEEI